MMISEKFTIEDIHKIRYENYKATKDLTKAELIEKTKADAEKFISRLKKANAVMEQYRN